MSRTLGLLSVLLLAASVPAIASAQDTGNNGQPLDEAARLTFESAREAFVAGDYETALARFRQAYQLSPRAGLLYNIAQSLDRLRRDEETVQALRDYLQAAPDAPNRSEVEARIRVLERALAERRQAEPPPDDGNNHAQPSGPGLAILHPAFFIGAAGLALASAGVLIWSGVETLSLNDHYLTDNNRNSVERSYNAANDQQLLTNVFIGVTAALGVAAVALAVFTDWNAFGGGSGEHARVRPLFMAGAGAGWVGLEGEL